jgi:hypothetical protein
MQASVSSEFQMTRLQRHNESDTTSACSVPPSRPSLSLSLCLQGAGWPLRLAGALLGANRRTPSSGRGWSRCSPSRTCPSVALCSSRPHTCWRQPTASTGRYCCGHPCHRFSALSWWPVPTTLHTAGPSPPPTPRGVQSAFILLAVFPFTDGIWKVFSSILIVSFNTQQKPRVCCFPSVSVMRSKCSRTDWRNDFFFFCPIRNLLFLISFAVRDTSTPTVKYMCTYKTATTKSEKKTRSCNFKFLISVQQLYRWKLPW